MGGIGNWLFLGLLAPSALAQEAIAETSNRACQEKIDRILANSNFQTPFKFEIFTNEKYPVPGLAPDLVPPNSLYEVNDIGTAGWIAVNNHFS